MSLVLKTAKLQEKMPGTCERLIDEGRLTSLDFEQPWQVPDNSLHGHAGLVSLLLVWSLPLHAVHRGSSEWAGCCN